MTTSHEIDQRIAGQNLPSRFLANVELHRDLEVLQWKDSAGSWKTWTLLELADVTARLTTALADLGVGPGDVVVLMIRNRVEFHALDLAVLFLGATPVSIYNSSAPEQVEYVINDCKAKVAIVEDEGFLSRFTAVRNQIPTVEHIAVIEGGESVDTEVVRYADMIRSKPADLATQATVANLDDLATIIYTSGTTGPPKGVMLSHSNVIWTIESVGQSMRAETGIDDFAGKRYLSFLPMAHIMERLLGHYFMIDFAMNLTCCPRSSELAGYVSEIHPEVLIGVPRVWEKLYAGVNAALSSDPERHQAFNEAIETALPITERMTRGTATQDDVDTWNFLDQVAFNPVRERLGLDQADICLSGAAPLSADILTWFRAIGIPLAEGYGMSETTAVLTWSVSAKPGFVGVALPGVEIKIAADGEVLARGGNIFAGYIGRPDKTSEALDADGWVHTGDIGLIDDEGFLKIVDRKKELIITAGGKNISPANLEAELKMIPLVGQACAVGEKRPFVAALVVLDPDSSAAWARQNGLTGDAAELESLAKNAEVIAIVEAGLTKVMAGFNNAESVKKVKILPDEWHADSDLLTPTSKLKRRGIMTRFADEIEELYAK